MKENEISPNDISDFILTECRERGEVLTNLKIQKLLYYAQAWYLADHDKSLFEEDFQAWIHGPVLPSQHRRFKSCEWRPILDEISKPILDKEIENHLIKIIDFFGEETAITLERMTHNENPWKDARKGIVQEASSNNTIKKESIKNFYKNLPE